MIRRTASARTNPEDCTGDLHHLHNLASYHTVSELMTIRREIGGENNSKLEFPGFYEYSDGDWAGYPRDLLIISDLHNHGTEIEKLWVDRFIFDDGGKILKWYIDAVYREFPVSATVYLTSTAAPVVRDGIVSEFLCKHIYESSSDPTAVVRVAATEGGIHIDLFGPFNSTEAASEGMVDIDERGGVNCKLFPLEIRRNVRDENRVLQRGKGDYPRY